jgi:hypothetical protein
MTNQHLFKLGLPACVGMTAIHTHTLMKRLLLLICLLVPVAAQADPISSDRRTTWQGNVGVPGGIPNRAVTTTLNPSGGDDTPAIKNAINALPSGGCLKLNAGTYNLSSNNIVIVGKNNFTIRGAGQGQTIIKGGWGSGAFHFGQADYPYPTSGPAITAGASRGSTTFTLGSTSSFAVGNLCVISQTDPAYVVGNDAPRNMTITLKVVSKTSTTVTVDHPLPIDFANSPQLIPLPTAPMSGVGFEDLTIDLNNTGGSGINWEQTWGCWIKNVEITRSNARQMFLYAWNQGEIRHCTTHNTNGGGPNHEGIDLYFRCCWNLVEDNICDSGGHPEIVLGDSHGQCVGNVIAYNYTQNVDTATDTSSATISFSHGGHNMFNLAEGNICNTGIASDGYWGSTSHNTILRNWCRSRSETVLGITTAWLIRGISLCRWSVYHNIVGNVLGDPSWPNDSTVTYDPAPNTPGKYSVYLLGFPNGGNAGYAGFVGPTNPPDYTTQPNRSLPSGYQAYDSNVRATALIHGNYDYKNKTIIWNSNVSDHSIPQSYIYSAKPAYFGNLTWPPVDPSNPSALATDSIPAGYRFAHGSDPAPGSGGPNPTPPPTPPPTPTPAPTLTPAPTATPASTATPEPSATATPVPSPGGSATPPTSATLSFSAGSGTITAPFAINSDGSISQPVQTTDPTLGGEAIYNLNITDPGDYAVAALVDCVDGGSNSFFVNIDSEPTGLMLWNITPTSGTQPNHNCSSDTAANRIACCHAIGR